MDFNITKYNDLHEVQRCFELTEKERQILRLINTENTQLLFSFASGKPISFFWESLQHICKKVLPESYGVLLTRKRGGQHWELFRHDEKSTSLLNSDGRLGPLPRALLTFSESPSRSKNRENNIQTMSDWGLWHNFLLENSFSDAIMLNVPQGQHDDFLMVFFQCQLPNVEDRVMDLLFDNIVHWVKAASLREYSDRLLFEEGHRDPETGLLRRYSFSNNFAMVLKDSRRHFQRVALISLRVRTSTDKGSEEELQCLAELIQRTVRDNDLVSYYGDGEFVTGIRIRHMQDAEVVANKLLKAVRVPEFSSNKLLQDGITIGISFYPEHSSLEDLYRAASFASNSVNTDFGFRIEFHGSTYASSDEFYYF